MRDGEILWRGGPVGTADGRRDDARAAGRGAGRRLSRRRGARARPPAAAGISSEARSSAGWRRCSRRRHCRCPGRRAASHSSSSAALGCCPGRGGRARRSNRSTGQAAGRWRGWGCGSAPRRSMSSRCSAPMRSASARCFGRCGTAERRRSCRADADRGKAIAIDPDIPLSFYAAIGRRVVAGLALRPDRLERLAAAARNRARAGPFAADAELAALGGVAPDALRGFCWRSAIAPSSKGIANSLSAKPRRRAPDGRKARTHRRRPQRQSVRQTEGAEIRLIASDCRRPERAKTRLDQWLWFARFVKSRSLAARLCAAGAVDDQWQHR